MFAITLRSKRVVAYSASIPAGLRRSVKPRLHPSSGDECKRRRSRRVWGPRLAYLYLSQSPSPDFRLPPRFVFLALSLKRRSQGRVRQDDVINYHASKPSRAFICTTLALSLAPLLTFLVETTPTVFCARPLLCEIARTRPDE